MNVNIVGDTNDSHKMKLVDTIVILKIEGIISRRYMRKEGIRKGNNKKKRKMGRGKVRQRGMQKG